MANIGKPVVVTADVNNWRVPTTLANLIVRTIKKLTRFALPIHFLDAFCIAESERLGFFVIACSRKNVSIDLATNAIAAASHQ